MHNTESSRPPRRGAGSCRGTRILGEYDEITARPAFRFAEAERRALLEAIERLAEPVVAAPLRLALPDPDDRMFVEVARAGRADAIVTGNTRHFVPRRGRLGITVRSPRELVDRLPT